MTPTSNKQRVFGIVAWTAADIQKLKPKWSIPRCEEWLNKHDIELIRTTTEAGYKYLTDKLS